MTMLTLMATAVLAVGMLQRWEPQLEPPSLGECAAEELEALTQSDTLANPLVGDVRRFFCQQERTVGLGEYARPYRVFESGHLGGPPDFVLELNLYWLATAPLTESSQARYEEEILPEYGRIWHLAAAAAPGFRGLSHLAINDHKGNRYYEITTQGEMPGLGAPTAQLDAALAAADVTVRTADIVRKPRR
ncbi:MAG: hypothetical protein OXE58_15940 [Acidobacteria bacterium]|nr:hypothetical protein [Acidobacteriota bacterium]